VSETSAVAVVAFVRLSISVKRLRDIRCRGDHNVDAYPASNLRDTFLHEADTPRSVGFAAYITLGLSLPARFQLGGPWRMGFEHSIRRD